MAEIVGGLFGVSPEQLMRQRQATDAANAFRYAQLDPLEQAKMSIYQGAAGLGRGIQGLLGGDPELEKISKIKQLSSQFDLTNAEGARKFAQALQPFAPQEAMMAIREAERMEQAGLTRQKTATDIQRTEGLISKEDAAAAQNEKLRAELSDAVQRGASRLEIRNIAAKYGSADKILQILSKEEERANALAVAAAGRPPKEEKPLPAGTMKEIATAEKNNYILTKSNETLDSYIDKVENDKIKFTLGTNIAGWVQKQTGKQDENTREQVSLKKFLENERNNILLSAKGTQTEGDAQRAMSQIFDTTDWRNSESVKQALTDLKTYKETQIDANNVFVGALRNEAPKQAAPKGGDKQFAADYSKYKAKYGVNALPYEAYVAKRKGL